MQDPLTFEQAFGFLVERFGATQTFWNIYIVVSLGLLGFVAGSKAVLASHWIRRLAIVGFTLFAISNWGAMEDVRTQREALIAVARTQLQASHTEEYRNLLAEMRPPTQVAFGVFHAVIDVIVLLALWRIPPREEKIPAP